MVDTPDEPQWNLLPHDPVRFFTLDEGFDRKDLKRAYNRLLRVYKPEKFPAEFQQIRAAYEQLDEQLRYHGGAAQRRVPLPEDWQTDTTESQATGSQATGPQSVGPHVEPPLVERLQTESPGALYEELKQRPHKTPYDYYALALLADVVENTATGFAKWLIEGIAAHRQDGALKQLLHDYFRGPQSGAVLLKLLPAVAKAVRTDDFYPLTEPAWQVVLRECDFRKFADTYDRCEAELRDSHIVGRMAFLIHMLKSAMWLDEQFDGWSARQFNFIEENFSSIPPWLEWDVEILGMAREYLAVRQQFASGSPLRSRIDAALEDYFSQPQEVGDRSVVATQMELLTSGDALMDEFPIDQGELLHKFFPIWSWATHDVAERQAFKQDEEVEENIWASRAVALLGRLEKRGNSTTTGMMWTAAIGARIVLLVVIGLFAGVITGGLAMVLLAPLEQSINATDDALMGFSLLLGGTMAVGLPGFLRSRIDQKLWFPLNEKFARKLYNKFWRRELMDFQRRSRVPDQFFRALFNHFSDKSATASWINEFVRQDFAPALLAGAQRYEA